MHNKQELPDSVVNHESRMVRGRDIIVSPGTGRADAFNEPTFPVVRKLKRRARET